MTQPSPSDPHQNGENPEEHMGEVIPDPWNDPTQTDWPMADGEVSA